MPWILRRVLIFYNARTRSLDYWGLHIKEAYCVSKSLQRSLVLTRGESNLYPRLVNLGLNHNSLAPGSTPFFGLWRFPRYYVQQRAHYVSNNSVMLVRADES